MLVELVILAVLQKQECSIYRIKKNIDEKFSLFYSPSLGSIYPALKKLNINKYVSVKNSKTAGGQKRSLYSITGNGKKYFEEIMLNDELNEQVIKIKLLVLPEVEKTWRITIIKNIRNYYEYRLLSLENLYENYRLSYIKHCIDSISEEISWLNRYELL